MKKFKLTILSPEKEYFSGETESLTANAIDGEISILADHALLVTILGKGRISFGRDEIKIKQGMLKVKDNQVIAAVTV